MLMLLLPLMFLLQLCPVNDAKTCSCSVADQEAPYIAEPEVFCALPDLMAELKMGQFFVFLKKNFDACELAIPA